MKKVLVTGGAGFIGSNLALELEGKGYDVTVLDDYSSGHFSNLHGFKGELVIGDESKLKDVEEPFDIIFHEAAITDTTFKDDKEMLRKNIEGFKKVLAFAVKHKSTLVYASSAGVYGAGKPPMKEQQKLTPLNAYAYSKYIMDNLARKHYNKGVRIVGVRYFNVFGHGESYKGKSASMIYQLYEQMKTRRSPRIFKYGEQVRDHIYVKDVVHATIKAAQAKENGVFNVGTGVATSFNKIIEHLNKAMKTSFSPEYFENPYTGVYQDNTQADMTHAAKVFGFKPRYTVKKGIFEYVKDLESIKK